jgi:PBSX family phage terminase large subunit
VSTLASLPPQARDAFLADVMRAARERVAAKRMSTRKREFRGAMADLRNDHSREIIISGPAGTGKSLGIIDYINELCWEYPGIRVLFVRKVRADLAFSALVTYERHILGPDNPICSGMQPENRRVYRYPNGSEIVIGGLDRVTSVMSQEYDVIYVQEAVEITEADWEALSTRLRNGVLPWQQLLGDTNPDSPEHWIMKRSQGGTLKLYYTTHADNPAYWDVAKGDWTPEGREYVIGALGALTGVRKLRLLDGKWVVAEGAVYEDYRYDVHVIDRFDIPASWPRYRAIDFGYTNPFVCQWWAVDPDGRMYMYREIYMTQRLVEDHAKDIIRLSKGETIIATISDHDAEDRATLHRHGVMTVAAKKDITVGIEEVRARYRIQEDGKPRIFFFRDALVERDETLVMRKLPTSTVAETPGYAYPKNINGKPIKEVPVDLDNHGQDSKRYMAMHLRRSTPVKRTANPFYGHGG